MCDAVEGLFLRDLDVGALPAAGAVNRPLPRRPGGPPIALDLTAGPVPDGALLGACDLLLLPVGTPAPDHLLPGMDVCWIRQSMSA